MYISLKSKLIAELPHPIYNDSSAQPVHVLLVLFDVSRIYKVLFLPLAEIL